MKMTRLALLMAFVLMAIAGAASAADYDFVSSFSGTTNPNGVWSYGWAYNGSFTKFIDHNDGDTIPGWFRTDGSGVSNNIWKNNSGGTLYGVAPGQVSLHSGRDGSATIARWTAPTTGTVKIKGSFLAGDSGIMNILVSKSESGSIASLWSASNAGAFDLSVDNMQAGDSIDFAVLAGASGWGAGNTPLNATVSTVPEPGTILAALSILAPAGMIFRRRKTTAS